jgi:hypothetical protein
MGVSLALLDWDQLNTVLANGGPWMTEPPIFPIGDPVPEPAAWVQHQRRRADAGALCPTTARPFTEDRM